MFFNTIYNESTFFRIHLTAFTFVPLIFSGIFYACNGRFHIRYIDALFLCYSAMTDTGLTTANLSTLTAWQQVILYAQMILGDTTTVSWIMVLVRMRYFRTECEHIVSTRKVPARSHDELLQSISRPIPPDNFTISDPMSNLRKNKVSVEPEHTFLVTSPTPSATINGLVYDNQEERAFEEAEEQQHISDVLTFSSSPRGINIGLPTSSLRQDATSPTSPSILRQRRVLTFNEAMPFPQRGMTIVTTRTSSVSPTSKKYEGFGGFPGPLQIANMIFRRAAPGVYRRIQRKMTIPYTTTLERELTRSTGVSGPIVGRNSDLHTEEMTDEELIEIGGIEYGALRLLSYLIPIYFLATQLCAYILYAPWLSSTSRYDDVFEAQPRLVKKPWFSLFLATSAYTGTGLTLMDTSMIPFQEAYLMIFGIMFVLLAGNHAQPIFLRFIIWTSSRFAKENSVAEKTLSFLLHHPRRCFLYLFPSHQTWFLLMVLVLLSAIEWLAFGVLNLGLESFQSLSLAPRVILGLFQGIAVRASGLTIIPIGSLAPALQFLYVVLMYIAVYPVAMCIRATNVYEEKSLGIFETPEGDIPEDLDRLPEVRERVGKYVGWHFRRQLSIDIWWLVWGIFIVTIAERDSILDPDRSYVNMFSIIFELVSAFGGIGLSLGLPTENFSLVGAMHPISKLVIMAIMVRGRHRGLPVAVDRAVLQPAELSNAERSKSAQNTAQDPVQQAFNLSPGGAA